MKQVCENRKHVSGTFSFCGLMYETMN